MVQIFLICQRCRYFPMVLRVWTVGEYPDRSNSRFLGRDGLSRQISGDHLTHCRGSHIPFQFRGCMQVEPSADEESVSTEQYLLVVPERNSDLVSLPQFWPSDSKNDVPDCNPSTCYSARFRSNRRMGTCLGPVLLGLEKQLRPCDYGRHGEANLAIATAASCYPVGGYTRRLADELKR